MGDAGVPEVWEAVRLAAAELLEPGEVAGSPGFISAFVRRRVQAADRLARLAIRTLNEGEPGEPTAQVVGLLLRLCIQPRVLHLFRGHFARSLTNLASDFDTMMRNVAAALWRTSPGWSQAVDLQVRLPLRAGGMGLRPVEEIAPAAYLGSWAQVLPDVERLVGGAPILGPDAPASPTAAAVQAAEAAWRALAARPGAEPIDWNAARAQRRGLRKQQRVLSQAVDRERRERLRRVAPPADWTRLQNCAGIWAGVWLTVPPTEHGLSFLDGEYAALVRFRLRVPLQPEGGPCRRGGTRGGSAWRRWYDAEGDHAHSCTRNSGSWTRRHGHLRDQLQSMLRWLGFWAETEQEDSRLPHRPDVRAMGFTLPLTHFEVHVSHPARSSEEHAQDRHGSSTCAFVEEAWRRRLTRHYAGGPPPDAPFQLIPAVVSSYGGWHPDFAHWWRGAVRAAAERAGPSASPQGMLWRTVGFLSVTLQRQNFQVLAGCAPTLEHQVQGRLGRPLSEVPEFWRAAPEAAVLWGAEEFGYPPSPRPGGQDSEAPTPALMHSAAGHVRAAGMRL